jgi:ADP-ribose pyrophosphatase
MADQILVETPYLRLIAREGWYFVERPHVSGVVTVVAVTDEGRLILVEQPRPPMGSTTIELPSGLVGDEPEHAHEGLAAGARRELLEETGYDAATMELVATCATTPGMTNEMVSIFRAGGLRKVTAGGGVGGERIHVHEVPLAEADTWLAARAANGTPIAVKVYAGLHWARRPSP